MKKKIYWIILVLLVLPLNVHAASTRKIADEKFSHFIKPNELIGLTGRKIKSDKALKVNSNNALLGFDNNMNGLVAETGMNPPQTVDFDPNKDFALPIPAPRSIDYDDIQKQLNNLSHWGHNSEYQSYFLLLASPYDFLEDSQIVGNVNEAMPGPSPIAIYDQVHMTMTAKYFQNLTGRAFQDGTGIQDNSPENAIFIHLDSFNSFVPVHVVNVVESGFINGLVTRLILGQCSKIWSASGFNCNLDINFTPQDLAKNAFTDPSNWPATTNFDDSLQAILDNNPIQPDAILLGWKAGGQLAQTGNEAYLKNVWRLLSYRYTMRQLGSMVSYTLNYLIGYTHNARIANIQTDSVPMLGPSQADQILLNLGKQSSDVSELQDLNQNFFDLFLSEYYALSANQKLDKNNKAFLLSQYKAFLEGFNTGNLIAADEVYKEVFKLAFGLGYTDGFRDGFSKGYSEGYKDGDAHGYRTAWAEAQSIIDNLKTQISSLNGQISGLNGQISTLTGQVVTLKGQVSSLQTQINPTQNGSLLSNVGNAVNTAGDILNGVLTIGGIIASFF